MLYKYLPPERVDVLSSNRIRFSPFKSLNDPFEATPLIDVNMVAMPIITQVTSEAKTFFTDKYSHDLINQFTNLLEQSCGRILTPFKMGANLIERLGNTYGILSLSRDKITCSCGLITQVITKVL